MSWMRGYGGSDRTTEQRLREHEDRLRQIQLEIANKHARLEKRHQQIAQAAPLPGPPEEPKGKAAAVARLGEIRQRSNALKRLMADLLFEDARLFGEEHGQKVLQLLRLAEDVANLVGELEAVAEGVE